MKKRPRYCAISKLIPKRTETAIVYVSARRQVDFVPNGPETICTVHKHCRTPFVEMVEWGQYPLLEVS